MAAHATHAAPDRPDQHPAAAHAAPSAAPGAAPDPTDPHGHHHALDSLVHLGTSLARLLHDQAHAQAGAAQQAAAQQVQPR